MCPGRLIVSLSTVAIHDGGRRSGGVFLHDIAALPIFRPESNENDDVPDVEDFDDDASQFTTASINSALEGDISNHRGTLIAGAEQNEKGSSKDDENSANSQHL